MTTGWVNPLTELALMRFSSDDLCVDVDYLLGTSMQFEETGVIERIEIDSGSLEECLESMLRTHAPRVESLQVVFRGFVY